METRPEYRTTEGERILIQKKPEQGGHNAWCYFGKHTCLRSESEQVLINGLSLRICQTCLAERGL